MHPRHSESSGNMFMVLSLIALGIAVVLSGAVFAYAHYLEGVSVAKGEQIQQEQQSVSPDTVQGFLRLSNRLKAASTVLNNHVTISRFLDVIEALTLKDVRFASLSVTTAPDGTADVKMTGNAKTFNALAAQSAAFAEDPRIKQAIFSGISADEQGVVGFSVSAKLDAKLTLLGTSIPASWTGAPAPAAASSTAPAFSSATSTATTTP